MIDEDSVSELIKYNIKTYDHLQSQILNISKSTPMLGIVIDVSKNKTVNDTYYGIGSVKVFSPELAQYGQSAVWALPLRSSFGSVEIPLIGNTVLMYSIYLTHLKQSNYYYVNMAPLDSNPFSDTEGYGDYFNPEKLGFTFKPSIRYKGHSGGRYTKDVIENPGEAKLIASTNTFVFYQSDKDKQIHLKGGNNYQLKMHVGDGGQVRIGYLDEITDAYSTGSADVDIDSGNSGNIDLVASAGKIRLTTKTGTIDLKSTSGNITARTGSSILISAGGKITSFSGGKTSIGASKGSMIFIGSLVKVSSNPDVYTVDDSLQAILNDLFTQLSTMSVICTAPGSPSTPNPAFTAPIAAIQSRSNLLFTHSYG